MDPGFSEGGEGAGANCNAWPHGHVNEEGMGEVCTCTEHGSFCHYIICYCYADVGG